jgi:thiamine biosynthesis protein ThiS
MPQPVEIVLNGTKTAVPVGTTVLGLLGELGIDPHKIAVERNTEIVPRATYGDVLLASGDRLEIVGFVGGG